MKIDTWRLGVNTSPRHYHMTKPTGHVLHLSTNDRKQHYQSSRRQERQRCPVLHNRRRPSRIVVFIRRARLLRVVCIIFIILVPGRGV